MPLGLSLRRLVSVSETYAVVWAEGDQPTRVGRLDLRSDGFRLTGDSRGGEADRVVRASEIVAVRVGHQASDRLREMKTVIVTRRVGGPVAIASVDGLGAVIEIAELLSELGRGTVGFQSVLVRVPIRHGRLPEVRALVGRGPPFQPGEIAGLRHHEVFVCDQAVIFLFQGRDVRRAVDQMARNPAVWKAAVEWRNCLAGRPTIVDSAYRWSLDDQAQD